MQMVTPLEQAVLDSLVEKLRADKVEESVIAGLIEAFQADRLPTPDQVAELIRDGSGDKTA